MPSLQNVDKEIPDVSLGDDEAILNKMNYTQELHRGFNSLMSFSFCFTAVAAISSISGLFPSALSTGGPVVVIWSWIGGSICTVCVALSLAEICSTYPSAGSVYHWAGSLSPERYAPLASYITGWFNFMGNVAGDAFYGYAFASSVSGIYELHNSSQLSTNSQVAIASGVCLCWALLNLARIDKQGWLNNFAAFWQIGATFSIVITLLVTCVRSGNAASADQVFYSYYDGTGFGNPGYVVVIGLLSALYSFSGYEAAAHMAEETKRAASAAPMGILWTCIATAFVGFVYLLGLLFASASDVDAFVTSGNSTIGIYQHCAGNSVGFLLGLILTINMFFSGMSSLTVTTRIAYAMARDGAFPKSERLKQVDSRSKVPLNTVWFVLAIDILLILLNLINSTAFIAVTSIATIGYQISYAIPIFMRVTFSSKTFMRRDFHLGRFSNFIGWISVLFLSFTSICFLFPTQNPITSSNMNYTSLVLLGTTIIGAIHWHFSARKIFTGPKRGVLDTFNDQTSYCL